MKMLYYPYDFKCEFFYDKHNRITIENKEVFEQFVIDLEKTINKEEEIIFCEQDEKEIKLDKTTCFITSTLDLRYNKKEYQKFLFNKLIEELQLNDMEIKIADVYTKLLEQMDALKTKTTYNIDVDEELDYSAIFKMLNIELSQPQGNFVEKLLDYMKTQWELMNKNIFFVINCSAFIDGRWYNEIVKWCDYQNVFVIFVENRQVVKDKCINEYILDHDMCEIH